MLYYQKTLLLDYHIPNPTPYIYDADANTDADTKIKNFLI